MVSASLVNCILKSEIVHARFAALQRSTRQPARFLRLSLILLWAFALWHAILPAEANVSLAPVFTDGMVLQREAKVSIWGTALPNEKVSVEFADQHKSAVANAKGEWIISLDPLSLGSPHNLTVSSDNKVVVKNVQVGDVWLCSGQSNMLMSIAESDASADDLSQPDKVGLSMYVAACIQKTAAKVTTLPRKWLVPNATTVGQFPAIPFLLGRSLALKEKVPVGIICTACSGAGIESFLPPEAVARLPEIKPNALSHTPVGINFTNLIQPYLNMSMRGIVWYQGESNFLNSSDYKTMFPMFISDVRKRCGNPNLPFYFVQLPNFGYRHHHPEDSYFAEFRVAQTAALTLPNVYMIVSMNPVKNPSLHPKEKRQIALRVAETIEKSNEEPNGWHAPRAIKHTVKENTMTVTFAGDGEGLTIGDGKDVARGFQIAGKDKKFFWADAQLQGRSVLLSSPDVAVPAAARYAWADNPDSNVFLDGQALAPFRTDNWETKPTLNESAWPF